MVTFTKFGSCVTSDLFNFLNISLYYPLHTYTGITISNVLEKVEIPILDEDIVADNGFWFNMQKFCFNHSSFEYAFKDKKSDFFIFDLADERLPLQKWRCAGSEADIPVTWNTFRTSKNVIEKKNGSSGGMVE